MDFGFDPVNDGFNGLLRRVFSRRANTTLIAANGNRNTVHDFIQHLQNTNSITKPIGDILLGSHANSQGYLFTPMFKGQKGPTNFETLEDTITNKTSKESIAVADSVIGFSTGNPITHNLHIKGCNIGKSTVFLNKFKTAIGGHMKVTAPLHFYGLFFLSSHGTWELMAYEFRIIQKNVFGATAIAAAKAAAKAAKTSAAKQAARVQMQTAIVDARKDYITALGAKGFTYYNNDPITAADWASFVPTLIDKTSAVSINWPLGTTFGKRKTIPFIRQFRYLKDKYTMTINFPTKASIPTDAAARMAALKTALTTTKHRPSDSIGSFDATHPFPEYIRWGYLSLQNFIDEHDWQFSTSGNKLICTGFFHAYTLLIPITDRKPANLGNLIFNFYPKSGSALSPISTGLLETDTNFFACV